MADPVPHDRPLSVEEYLAFEETLAGDGTIVLPCPPLTLSLDEIYEGVEFPSPEEMRRVREAAAAYG